MEQEINTLYFFDFDATIMDSVGPEEGVETWKNITGKEFPAYSAVFLRKSSKNRLIKAFDKYIPKDWNVLCDHMTISMGELPPSMKRYVGQQVMLIPVSMGHNDKAFAMGVKGFPSENKVPHITIATEENGYAKYSNDITNWKTFQTKARIYGVVRESQFDWWSSIESLDTNIFNFVPYPKIVNKYNEAMQRNDAKTILLTGRNNELKPNLIKILNKHGLIFDEYSLERNNLDKKPKRIKEFLKNYPNVKKVVIYDDRESEIKRFLNLKPELDAMGIDLEINVAKEGELSQL